MLIPFREITRDALRRRYAVGAFNCLSVENVMGAVAAAEELHSPIILQLAEVQFPEAPMELMAPVFLRAARDAKVPVAVHLDHGRSIETCIRAVREGFTSVMFDGAELPFEENAEQTRLVVRLAHAAGVDVEAELGRVGDTGFGGEGTAAAAAEPIRMAILPRSMSATSENASESTKSDIVKPMPPKQATASSIRHEAPSGMAASPVFTEIHAARNMPSGLPTTSPKKTPMPIDPISGEWVKIRKYSGEAMPTPAFARAKIGIMRKVT